MSVAYTAMLDDVWPFVPGAEEALIVHALRRATREFCRKSRVLTAPVTALAVTALAASTPLPVTALPAATEVDRIEIMFWNDNTNALTPIDVSSQTQVGPNPGDSYSEPQFCYVKNLSDLVLVPVPAEAGTVTGTLIMQPTLASTECADELANRHRHTIAAGALAYLLGIPKKPWSDPREAQAQLSKFYSECGLADMNRSVGRASGSLRTRAVYSIE